MKMNETIFLWNPNHKGENDGTQIQLFPLGHPMYYSDDFMMVGGACFVHVQQMTTKDLTRYIFIEAMNLIIGYKMDPQAVHNIFCEIQEYRYGLPVDSPVPAHLKQKFRKEIDGIEE